MSEKTKVGLTVLITGALLGLMGNLLLREGPVGLSGAIWIALLAGALLAVAKVAAVPLTGAGRWFLIPAVLLTAGTAWRGSEALVLLDFLGVCASLALVIRTARQGALHEGGVAQYGLHAVRAGVETLIGPFAILFSDISWKELSRGRWTTQTVAVARGLLIALPLVLVFGGLFVAADAVFAQMTGRVLSLAEEDLVGQIILTLIWGGLAAGFLRATLVAKAEALPDLKRPERLHVGAIETGVVLGLLNLLFLAFVAVQFRYLFGGAALVEATTGLTYAEYARKGFFELVSVSALVLPLLLGLHWLVPETAGRLFRYLAGGLVAQLFVIMGSALQRMLLYQGEYGLTEQRLYATLFMGWLALLFLWFVATVLRERRNRFVFGAVVSGFVLLAGLHLLNPDALIAQVNLARQAEGKPFDAAHTAGLGPDAVPLLMEALPRLNPADQRVIAERLLTRADRWANQDWRTWNWGQSRALALVEENRAILRSMRD